MTTGRSREEIEHDLEVREIAEVLTGTQVTICNERDVYDGDTLYKEFVKLMPGMFTHSNFVAIVVDRIADDYHESAVVKYQLKNYRGSGIFLGGWPRRLWMWDVTIQDTNFLVFGPYSFIRPRQVGCNFNDQVLVEEMVALKKTSMGDLAVFKPSVPKTRVHDTQSINRESSLQQERPVRTLEKSERDWRIRFQERHPGKAWAPGEMERVMTRDYAVWLSLLMQNHNYDNDYNTGIWTVVHK
jgi:hypothetical protein